MNHIDPEFQFSVTPVLWRAGWRPRSWLRGCDNNEERDGVRRATGVARFRSQRKSQHRSEGCPLTGRGSWSRDSRLEQCLASWRGGVTCQEVGGHRRGAGAGGQLLGSPDEQRGLGSGNAGSAEKGSWIMS